MHKKGLTLLEIIVSTIILAIIMTGLTNLFISGKRYILHSRARMTGGELGKRFLDPLQMDVTQGERSPGTQNGWGQANNCLSSNPTTGCPGAQTIDNIPYNPTHNISDVSGTTLRKVKLDITWNEPTP